MHPHMYTLELNNILIFSCLKNPMHNFPILQPFSFCSSNTHSAESIQIKSYFILYTCRAQLFYLLCLSFEELTPSYRSFPSYSLYQGHFKRHLQNHFINHFNPLDSFNCIGNRKTASVLCIIYTGD